MPLYLCHGTYDYDDHQFGIDALGSQSSGF